MQKMCLPTRSVTLKPNSPAFSGMRDEPPSIGVLPVNLVPLPYRSHTNSKKGDIRMTLATRAVSVKSLPEKLGIKQGRLFFRELESAINVEKPCIVFDCSRLQAMNEHAAHLL